jgi:putative addiction module killer protein
MKLTEREIRKLALENGDVPFDIWFKNLRDIKLQAAVDARLARVRAGNLGDHKSVGSGVSELRIDKGPGLRVYIGFLRQKVIVLIGGGDKSTQNRDIRRAKDLWQQFISHASQKVQTGPRKAPSKS